MSADDRSARNLWPGDSMLTAESDWYGRTSSLLSSLRTGAQRLRAGAEEEEQRRRTAAERTVDALADASTMTDALQHCAEQTQHIAETGSDRKGLVTIDLGTTTSPKVRVDPKLLKDPSPEQIASVVQEAIASVLRNVELGRLRALVELAEKDPSLESLSRSARARLAELEGTITADESAALGSPTPRPHANRSSRSSFGL